MESETELNQLLNMGFTKELATQALSATGGTSTLKATEWILNHKSISQPKLNRFFQSKPISPKPNKEKSVLSTPIASKSDLYVDTGNPKRQKVEKTQHKPLAERMRPRGIDEVLGQDQILGKGTILRGSVEKNRLPSMILWGPPGTGKTSIAKAIVNPCLGSSYRMVSLSAVTAGVKDVREVVEEANRVKKLAGKQTVLFVDEVHRFNKSQQDSFLPVIEDGSIVFVGATTENPSFHLITPLLSRCIVVKLNSLEVSVIEKLLRRAVEDEERGLRKSLGCGVVVEDVVIEFLSLNCDGDARVALNALESAAINAAARKGNEVAAKGKAVSGTSQTSPIEISVSCGGANSDPSRNEENEVENGVGATVTLDDAKEALQCKHLAYDRAGEEHYNLISALHKSMRGSDANASLYWLARMLEGGEQPLYIARRLVRFASEDVGLADPNALTQSVACYQACHFLGMPECDVNLAQCVAYLALAPKSIAVYDAIKAARKVVKESGGQNEGVPLHLRNAPTRLMKEFGYGDGYIYPPTNPSSSSTQTYLPPSLQHHKFFHWPDIDINQ